MEDNPAAMPAPQSIVKLTDCIMDEQIAHDLAERARCCREYAETNAQALRKIAKKHDKIFGLKSGQQFVQVTLLPLP